MKDGDAGKILAGIESGRIPEGSILIVEALDRLPRQSVDTAVHLFTGIVSRGVTLVTVLGDLVQEYRSGQLNMGSLMTAIVKIASAA